MISESESVSLASDDETRHSRCRSWAPGSQPRAALELARDKIRSSPDELIAHAFPDSDAGLCTAALIGDRHGTRPGSWEAFDAADRAQRQRLLEAGADATEKVEREGEEEVSERSRCLERQASLGSLRLGA